MKLTFLLWLWLGLTRIAPGLPGLLARRAHRRQGADPARLCERFGTATRARPEGRLIWIHAASLGEVVSISGLARLIMERSGAQILITTATATGAQAVAARVPGALHQFLPVDAPGAVNRFLAHWRPDMVLFVEADLWPRLLLTLARQRVPVALINARPSKTRKRAPRSLAALLRGVDLVTVQDAALMREFADLGIDPARIHAPGNLKADIRPLAIDPDRCAGFRAAAAGRKIWAAASTHPGEDEIILDAHMVLYPEALLLLVPRHPERGDAIAAEIARRGLDFSRHSAGDMPGPETRVHLLDAMGELGTVYAASDLALIGGSLLPGPGGHTPYEPAALGCAMITGPYVGNFQTAYDALQAAGATRTVQDADDLSGMLARLLADAETLARMRRAARAEQERHAGATERVFALLAPLTGT
ncbi:MAG: 3-deoxy-D-manno-octulosonic acid transferase [Pseudorhodobacter sp.]